METNFTKGISYILLSSLALAAMSALAKAASPYASTTIIVFFQNLVSFLLVLPWVLRAKSSSIKTQRIGIHILRAITGAGAWYCLFVAVRLISLGNAVLLTYSASLWIPLFAWLAFKQSVSKKVWLSLIIGFIGIGLILNPSKGSLNPGDLFGIGAAILLAIALLSVKALNKTEPTSRILFYYFLISSIVFFPLALHQWQSLSAIGYLYVFLIGVCLAISQLTVVLAYQFSSPTKLSPYIYFVVLFTAIIDWLVWHQVPSLLELSGMGLVILGGILTVFEAPKLAPSSHS